MVRLPEPFGSVPALSETAFLRYSIYMNKNQKDQIRQFIIERLYEESTHVLLNEVCYDCDIDDLFAAREFFEEQVERINKLFNYPQIRLDDQPIKVAPLPCGMTQEQADIEYQETLNSLAAACK